MTRTLARKLKQLERLYASLPKIECKRLCQDFCGVIQWSRIEDKNIRRATGGSLPVIQAKQLLEYMQAPKRMNVDGGVNCPMLKDGACSIYAQRPLVCRLWGVTEAMRCPHGCEPERWLTKEESYHLLAEVEKIWPSENGATDFVLPGSKSRPYSNMDEQAQEIFYAVLKELRRHNERRRQVLGASTGTVETMGRI